ncbi:CASP8 and FADD-like apoptosis regulator [Notolabrus celidotus]|uniref:CASP8 and FADD-like apoptosis regulator n=1 Tax=Notolabrus celidotus TaxID=1203425 RepID=UPI00148F8F39|nr:CASP8 and FADD-like apoptosis regulator [Notolabrus celidotus]
MAVPDQRQLHEINQIAEALSSCERRKLLYLCGSLDTDHSVACVKEKLKSQVLRQERGHLLLRELMLQLGRSDILRKVCKTSRDDVNGTLTYTPCLPRFRVLMANISEDMANDDLASVKFLLSSTLPREKMEKIKNFLDVIIELEKLDKISPERVDFVEECLRNINRVDLAKKVIKYKTSVSTSERQSPQQQMLSAPRPVTTLYNSLPSRQIRQAQSIHRVPQNVLGTSYREQSCQSQLDSYKFSTNPRGVCVIIDCVGNDGDMLEQTFKDLQFNVLLHKWLSVEATLSALRDTFRNRENLLTDSFVCCIISRGTENHLLGTDSNVAGLGLDSIRRLFTADSCPMLAGKPKLFFIQRYSVPEVQHCAGTQHRDEDLETDGASRYDVIPTEADVFWSHCWTDERQLVQGPHRSVYLKALTDALHKGQRRKTHLVDIHTEVNGAIFEHNRRNPGATYNFDLKHTLRKDLYLQ